MALLENIEEIVFKIFFNKKTNVFFCYYSGGSITELDPTIHKHIPSSGCSPDEVEGREG